MLIKKYKIRDCKLFINNDRLIITKGIPLQLLMKQLEPPATILDEANAVSLMLYLLENSDRDKPVAATDLLNVVKSYNRMKALADKLKDLGLVDVKVVKERNISFNYSLTEKGKEVAELLRRAVDLIPAP